MELCQHPGSYCLFWYSVLKNQMCIHEVRSYQCPYEGQKKESKEKKAKSSFPTSVIVWFYDFMKSSHGNAFFFFFSFSFYSSEKPIGKKL